jgi:hypothetical protein
VFEREFEREAILLELKAEKKVLRKTKLCKYYAMTSTSSDKQKDVVNMDKLTKFL